MRATLLILSITITFIVLRVWLHWSPNSDFNILGYNIHHLYTGLILLTLSGIPLILFNIPNRFFDFLTVVFGSGLSMALDEWVYLIVTDGSNESYLLPVSFWGGVIMIVAASVYTFFLTYIFRGTKKEYVNNGKGKLLVD